MDLINRSSLCSIYCWRRKFRQAGCWNEYKNNGKLEPEGWNLCCFLQAWILNQHCLENRNCTKKRVKADEIYWMLPIFFPTLAISAWDMTKLLQYITNEWFSHSMFELEMFGRYWDGVNKICVKTLWTLHCTATSGCPAYLWVLYKNCYLFHRWIWISCCSKHIQIFEHRQHF